MRNLKKVLSLALVLVMVLAVSASAVYPDQAAINDKYEADVNLVSAIKIMQGKGAGQFDPTGLVTRAEMAKMIYVGSNGVDDGATLFAGLDAEFSDLEGAGWAENYIKWANFKGIVVGSNGAFRPLANVKGVEAAKMILTQMGYNAEAEGYQNNADWQYNIADDAKAAGLLIDLDYSCLGRELTREEAAKMIANGLRAGTVTYGSAFIGGEWVSVADLDKDEADTLLQKNFGVKWTSTEAATAVTLLKTATKGIGGADGYTNNNTQELVTYTGAADVAVAAGVTIDPELLGKKVVVYYKDAADDTVYAIMDAGFSLTAEGEIPEYKDATGTAIVVTDTSAQTVVNYADATAGYQAKAGDGETVSHIYEVTKDTDGDYTAVIAKYTFVEKTYYTTATLTEDAITIKDGSKVDGIALAEIPTKFAAVAATALKASDVEGGEIATKTGVKVLVDVDYSGANGTPKYSIALPETITGYVTATSSKDNSYTINGKAYTLSEMAGAGIAHDATPKNDALDINDVEYTYVVVDGKLVDAQIVDKNIATTKYMLVQNFQEFAANTAGVFEPSNAKDAKVIAVLADGTKGTYTISALSTGAKVEAPIGDTVFPVAIPDGSVAKFAVVPYTMAEDGTLIVGVAEAVDGTGIVTKNYANGSVINVGSANIAVEAEAVFFVKTPTATDPLAYKVYTRANVPAIAASDVPAKQVTVKYYDSADTDAAIDVVVIDDPKAATVTGATTLLYVINAWTDVEGTTTTNYILAYDGTKVDTYVVSADATGAKNSWKEATLTDGAYVLAAAEGAYTTTTQILATNATITAIDAENVSIKVGANDPVTYSLSASVATGKVTVANNAGTAAEYAPAANDTPVLVIVNNDATEVVALYIVK